MKQYGLYNEEPVIRTFSGVWFNAFEPTEVMINIEDIAHALSHQCRFGGHLPRFFSVAQHSIFTSLIVQPEHKLAALMHDASEAYLLDIPRPIKNKLANYIEIEDGLMGVIALKYGFQWPLHDEVKKADEFMLQKEWNEVMMGKPTDIEFFSQAHAKQLFINEFNKLYGQAAVL
jgi:5'-deoxynucleotidase YfbR-like HD superfamily hydrolase